MPEITGCRIFQGINKRCESQLGTWGCLDFRLYSSCDQPSCLLPGGFGLWFRPYVVFADIVHPWTCVGFYSSFLPQSRNMHLNLIRNLKLPQGVSVWVNSVWPAKYVFLPLTQWPRSKTPAPLMTLTKKQVNIPPFWFYFWLYFIMLNNRNRIMSCTPDGSGCPLRCRALRKC